MHASEDVVSYLGIWHMSLMIAIMLLCCYDFIWTILYTIYDEKGVWFKNYNNNNNYFICINLI